MIHEDERRPPSRRLAFVLHLGDFIYEVVAYPEAYPKGRYARRVREDARARWPFVCVWDNHEFSWQGWQSQQVVCIPRPLERSTEPDGGPLAYRVIHRVAPWRAGEPPRMTQEVVEGVPPLATRSRG